MKTSTDESSAKLSKGWIVRILNWGCQRVGGKFALILGDNEAVPSLLDVVLWNFKTGYGSRQCMYPKIQVYMMLCLTLTGIGKEVMVKTKGMLRICNNHETDLHQVCGNS